MTVKICTRCHTEKSESDFSPRKGGDLYSWCKSCVNEDHRARRALKGGPRNEALHKMKEVRAAGARVCTGCLAEKALDEYSFASRGKEKRSSRCKSCESVYRKNYFAKNSEIIAQKAQERRDSDRDGYRDYHRSRYVPEKGRRNHLLGTYGIEPADYETLAAIQGDVCAVCKKKPEKFLCVDRDHVTGDIRGLLCKRCNQAAGLLKDSADAARALAAYLEAPPAVRLREHMPVQAPAPII